MAGRERHVNQMLEQAEKLLNQAQGIASGRRERARSFLDKTRQRAER